MKKFIEDTLLMLLGALITMLIIGLGELPTLSFETLIQLSLAVALFPKSIQRAKLLIIV